MVTKHVFLIMDSDDPHMNVLMPHTLLDPVCTTLHDLWWWFSCFSSAVSEGARKSKGSMWTNFILYVYSYLPSSLFFCTSITCPMTSLTYSLLPPHPTKMGTMNHSYLNWSPYPRLMTSSLRCNSTRFLKGTVHMGMELAVKWCVSFFPYLVFCLSMHYSTLSVIIYTLFNYVASFLLLTQSIFFMGR